MTFVCGRVAAKGERVREGRAGSPLTAVLISFRYPGFPKVLKVFPSPALLILDTLAAALFYTYAIEKLAILLAYVRIYPSICGVVDPMDLRKKEEKEGNSVKQTAPDEFRRGRESKSCFFHFCFYVDFALKYFHSRHNE